MSEYYEITRVANRIKFPGGPDEDPGIRLGALKLPGFVFAGRIAYVHVEGITDAGEILPSSVDAIDPGTGEIREPGDILLVDITTKPPSVIRRIGAVVKPTGLSKSDELCYRPESI